MARNFPKKRSFSTARVGVFSFHRPQESKDKLQNHWNYWEQHSPNLLLSLHIEKAVPRKVKSNRVPPLQSSELRAARQDAIGPGPSS